MNATTAASNTLTPLLRWSPSGPLENVYEYLTPSEARKLSLACKETRRIFINEKVQNALLHIHFPAMARGPFSSRGLFLRASVGQNAHTESIKTLSKCIQRDYCIKLSANGTKVISSFSDNTLKLWDLTTGAYLRTFSGHHEEVVCLEMSLDGTKFLSGSKYNGTLKLWDLRTGVCLRTFLGHRSGIYSIQMSRDGTKALSGSWDRTLKFWDLSTGKCLQTLSGHERLFKCIQMSANGSRALAGFSDHSLKLWDLTTGECIHHLTQHENAVYCLQMSADGTRAVSGSLDKTLKYWDLTTGACLKTLSGHEHRVSCLQLNWDEKRVLSGSFDNNLKLWDLTTGACLKTLTGHQGVIQCLQMSADGAMALSGACDQTLKLWDLTTGICLQTLSEHTDLIYCLQISADGTRALSGSADTNVKVWNLIPPYPQERVAKVAKSFFENRIEAKGLFSKLPGFVQDQLANALYKLHVRERKISSNQTGPDYGRMAFLQERGFTSLVDERNKVFADYMRRRFLPDAAEYLEECERQSMTAGFSYTESALFKEALECLDQLPISIQEAVYQEIYKIQKKGKTLPENPPNNYGDLAFHEKGQFTATIQERIQAIKKVMKS